MELRYRKARAGGPEALEQAYKEDAQLLEIFGLRLLSIESGVRAAVIAEVGENKRVQPWHVVSFDDKTWSFIRPLLERLAISNEYDEEDTDEESNE